MFFWFFVTVLADDTPAYREVETTSGGVRGFLSIFGLYEFWNIPYATAPTGRNKFGPPLPPIPWEDTYNATAGIILCPQPLAIEILPMDQNCLVASVYAPQTISEEKLPVVVYIHGGGFVGGAGMLANVRSLVKDHNIIGVTFNYRLGAHGFLCLGTDDIPGNAGMKDQVALLRWVRDNIENFGGNPQEVTIAGYSAGSASVDLLMLSKSAEGLFNKVIPESGANMASFAIQIDPLETAKVFAQHLDFHNVDDINALEEFYKNADLKKLLHPDSGPLFPNATIIFGPCIERPLSSTEQTGKEVFLDKSPREILESQNYKKVPLLYGFASEEGLLYAESFETWKTGMNERFSDFVPGDLIFKSAEEKEEVAQIIKEFYFGDGPIDNTQTFNFIDYYTDVMFAYGTLRSARIQVENGHNEIYIYEYNYVDENSMLIPHANGLRGAEHCAQSHAVFGMVQPFGENQTMTEQYQKLVTSVQQLWANFIKTGKPIPEGSNYPNLPPSWPPMSTNWWPHMSIGKAIELKGPLLLYRTQFWEGIYEKYYREPSPPIPAEVEVEDNSAGRNSAWLSLPLSILFAVFGGRFGL